MKNFIPVRRFNMLVVGLTAILLSFQSSADMFGGSGRYAMMQFASGAIWVLDTETGKVRTCQYMGNKPPHCSPWSKDK